MKKLFVAALFVAAPMFAMQPGQTFVKDGFKYTVTPQGGWVRGSGVATKQVAKKAVSAPATVTSAPKTTSRCSGGSCRR